MKRFTISVWLLVLTLYVVYLHWHVDFVLTNMNATDKSIIKLIGTTTLDMSTVEPGDILVWNEYQGKWIGIPGPLADSRNLLKGD